MPQIPERPLSLGELKELERRRQEYALHQAKITKRGSDGKGVNFRPSVVPRAIPWSVKG